MPNQPRTSALDLVRQIAVILALVATLAANYLSTALPINGLSMAELAARYDVLFKPAGYAFAIWGLIYIGLGAYVIYQARPSMRADKRLRSLDLPFLISAAANVSWLLLFHYEQVVASFVAMLVLLAALVAIYRRLDPERGFVDPGRRWAVHYPFRVYLGWISVASVANLAITLDHLGWSGWGLPAWAWYLIAVASVLTVAALVTRFRADVAYLATLTWAFVALGVAHHGQAIPAAISWIGTAALIVMIGVALVLQRR
jgi:hypothetical protein